MGSARVLGTYIFAKLMDYPVSFPESESNHPFRRTEISIQVHKDELETDGLASDPAADDSKELQLSKRPQDTTASDLPASDSMLDTPAPSA